MPRQEHDHNELQLPYHSQGVKSSPFFNVFANVNLSLFSHADCQFMVSQSLNGTGVQFSEPEMEHVLDLAGRHPYFLQAGCWILYESHRLGLGDEVRVAFLAEQFQAEAIPHFVDYWDSAGDHEKIVLTAAALLERAAEPIWGFSLADLQEVFYRSGPVVAHLEKRGVLMSRDARYRLFSSVFGPWILLQIVGELSEEQSYNEWLAENSGPVDRVTGEQGRLLREILPKIGACYRRFIITWASDPQTIAAMADLLENGLPLAD